MWYVIKGCLLLEKKEIFGGEMVPSIPKVRKGIKKKTPTMGEIKKGGLARAAHLKKVEHCRV